MNTLQKVRLLKRLISFETTFRKHADICFTCSALHVWKFGDPKPRFCRRCNKKLSRSFSIRKGVGGM